MEEIMVKTLTYLHKYMSVNPLLLINFVDVVPMAV